MSNTGRKGITFRPAAEGHGAAYVVTVAWKGHRAYKRFPVSAYGTERKSLAAALAWRDGVEERIGKPRTDTKVRSPARGNVGVWRYTPVGGGRDVWEARIKAPDGKERKARFSVERWGEEGAREKAIEQRKAWEQEFYGRSFD